MVNFRGTDADTAKLIAEAWTKKIEKPFVKALYMAELVTRRDSLVAGGGDTIHVPFNTTSNARDKAAGTAVTYDNNFGSPITISINKHKYLAVLIEDFAKVQANYDLQEAFRWQQAEAVARAIDSDLLGLHGSAGTNVSGGAAADDADILSVVEALDAGNVPRSQRYGVIHSEVMADLLGVNKYVAYDQTGQEGVAVTDGLVASLYGMKLYMSNNVVETAGAPNLLHNLFFHKSAMSLALQLKPTYKMEDSVDEIGMKTVLHAIYGVAVERSGAVVDLEINS
jgi:hypothetical protein